MSTDLEKEMKEIQLEDADQEKKEENPNPSKIIKVKRNPLEKIINDSILICDELIEKTESESNVDKLIKTLEKEIMKKEEFYNLVKLYEKAKKLKDDRVNQEDTIFKEEFSEIKNDLQNIKNSYDNKKKIVNKIKTEDKEKEEKATQPSKKKKTNNKKNAEMIDFSNVVATLSKIEENPENDVIVAIEECRTPVKVFEEKEIKEMVEEQNILNSPANNKNLDSKDSKNVNVESAINKNSVMKDASAKKSKNENNYSITRFFSKKSSSNINHSANSSSVKLKEFNEDNQMSKETESALIKIKPYENEIQKNTENLIDDSKLLFNVDSHNPHFATLDYILTNIDSGFSYNKIKLLRIKGNDINNLSDYHESLKNYLEEVSQIKKNSLKVIKQKNRKRKHIFIHDSFSQHKKVPEKTSNIINPRNPLKKDEYLIDYDKDSEEEFLEENAEDILEKSNENSDEEEVADDDEEEGIRWIVPDGHLSEDEVSQKEELVNQNGTAKKKNSVMDILEIRKNYSKPVIVNFNITFNSLDNKVKLLHNLCKARIFNSNINNNNNENNEDNCNIHVDNDNNDNHKSELDKKKFPIKITSKKSEDTGRKTGMNNNIKDKLEDIVREIHLSYMTKEFLIKVITEKFNDISKKSLSNFFRDSVLKIRCKPTQRKQWLVKKEILESANFLSNEYNQLLEKQNAIYEEKEKEKKKEIEENQINNQNILNEQRGLTFNNIDLNPPNNLTFNNNNLNQTFSLRNVQIPPFAVSESIMPVLNNQFNLQNFNINDLNKVIKEPSNILKSTEKSKTKRVKKEKTTPINPKQKSSVKLQKSSKNKIKKSAGNDHQFDLTSFSYFNHKKEKKDSL